MRTFYLGAWRVEPTARELSCRSKQRRVSPKAMQVLGLLAKSPGVVISRGEFMDNVWSGVTVGEEVLTQAIAELRRQLDDDPRAPTYIETVHKSGYRLITGISPGPRDIAPNLGPQLHSEGELDFDAYLTYLEGDELFERGGHVNIVTAVERFSDVIRVAPEFAMAHSSLAKSMAFLYLYYEHKNEYLEKALASSERAIQIDRKSAMGHAARGMALSAMGVSGAARDSFWNAIRLDPGGFEPHYLLGRACFAEGQYAFAAASLERAARLRWDDFHALVLAAKARRALGDERDAQRLCRVALRRIEAYREFEPDDLRAMCDLACCLVEVGDVQGALHWAQQVDDLDDPLTYYVACAFARAGEVPLAISHLERTIEAGWSHGGWLNSDKDLDNLRSEAKFRKIEELLCVNH